MLDDEQKRAEQKNPVVDKWTGVDVFWTWVCVRVWLCFWCFDRVWALPWVSGFGKFWVWVFMVWKSQLR